MDRRDFLKAAGIGAGASLLRLPIAGVEAGEILPTRLIPEDKGITPEMLAAWKQRGERRVYRGPNLYAIGMPVGGICAGQLYVLGDGTLGGWRIDGRLNPTGYGATNYQTKRAARELAQEFWLSATGGEALVRPLDGEGRRVEFIGEYPVAEVRYPPRRDVEEERRSHPLDLLEVTMRAYSPFCPLNAKDSALPCTVLRFRIHNPSKQRVSGVLQGKLQNGVEMAEPGEIQPVRRNRVVQENGLTAVYMDAVPGEGRKDPRPERVIADFEGETYVGWRAEGEAFGAGPAKGTRPHQNPVTGFEGRGLVNSFVEGENTAAGDRATGRLTSEPFEIDRDYLLFLIGGGNHRGQTCMNLLVDGKVVRTATGRAEERLTPHGWDVREFAGKRGVLQIVDAARGGWGHINVDRIVLTDALPEGVRRPRPDSEGFGSMCLAYLGRGRADAGWPSPEGVQDASGSETSGPVGQVTAEFSVGPGESVELVFVISWFFPNLHTGHGQMYANWFRDALDVARYVRANDQRLWAQTELFRKTYYEDTTLPWWLALRLMMPTANLATGTAQWWKNGRFWGWEGVGCCHGTCTHVWNYSHAEARLFPELARSTRVMQDLGTAFEEATGRVAFRGEVNGGFEYAADGQAGTVLKCYREHLCSADDSFLRANWGRIRKALEFLIAKDAELDPSGRADGVIQGIQHNTYDIDFVGANTFVGALYLAALHAGAAMAERMGDREAAARYRGLAERGRAWTEKNLFNGEYFIQRTPEGNSGRWQYGDGCLADQLFGQNWARAVGLPTVYDEEKVRRALRSVYRYAWAPPGGALRQYNAAFPPEREFARDREGGLFICTWPKGGRPGEPVRYRDEVWTGIEYQVAAGMVWEGMVDEALAIVRAVDDRYDGALHNPWNEVECGDHYARAMAAWGVYLALCGFEYDGPAGVIGMDPRLTPERFAAFFSGAEGWGLMSQAHAGGEQVNRFEARWGRLRVREIRARVAAGLTAATVSVAGQRVGCRVEKRGERVGAVLNDDVVVEAGQTLEVRWRA